MEWWRDGPGAPQGTRAFAWTLAAHALVAVALATSDGHDDPFAEVLVYASVVAVAAGLRATTKAARDWPFSQAATWCVAMGSAVCVVFMAPGIYVQTSAAHLPFVAMSAAAAAVVGSYAVDFASSVPVPAWVVRARPAAMLALAAGLGVWMLHASPAPRIDVWVLDQQASDALLHGRRVYGHGALSAVDTYTLKRVIDTYDYPPLTLVLSTLAYAVTGETRWASLVAILLGAALLRAFARRTTGQPVLADLLMACVLFHPSGLFVLEQAWGEPLALPFLAAFALAATAGRPRLAAVMLGLLCALKQHFLLYLPALALLPGIGVPGAAIALGTLAATYAPFAVGSPEGMWASLVVHHLKNPFRPDSLSLPAMLSNAGIMLPSWLGFAATTGSFVVLRWVPRKVGPLVLATTLPFLLFYVLGRQAFCNYYYLLGPTWLIAAAALTRSRSAPAE